MKGLFILAGHGLSQDGKANDNGATGNNLQEYTEVSQIVGELRKLVVADPDLSKLQVTFLGDEQRLSLPTKIKTINNICSMNGWGVDDALALELHCNWSPDKKVRGIEAWIGDKKLKSKDAASMLVSKLHNSTGLPVRNPAVQLSSANRLGSLGITDETTPNAVLLEVAFLSNADDDSVLGDDIKDDVFSAGILSALRLICGFTAEVDVTDKSFYIDVPSSVWFEQAVRDCLKDGILVMSPERLFRPDKPPTRAEMVTFGARIISLFRKELAKTNKLP